MEQGKLERIENELSMLRKAIENMQEYLIDDEAGLEVSDEVLKEVGESRKKKGEDLVSHDEVFKRYCK